MSWINHVPGREPDGILRLTIQPERHRPAYDKEVMIWLKENKKVTKQDHIEGDKWSMISVDCGAEQCPYGFPYDEWQEFLIECILLERE